MTDPGPDEEREEPRGPGTGATPAPGAPQAPWAPGEQQPPGPAPIIEVDSPVDPGPVKPLGPRRLARLQREMAEHQRQVRESERQHDGGVDEDLLLKQRRFAELAVRAAAANERDRSDAQAAAGAAEPPGSEAPHEPQAGTGGERIEVVFPRFSALNPGLSLDPGPADPAQLASSPLAPGPGPETTRLHLFTGVAPEVPAAPVTAPQGPADAVAPGTASGPTTAGERDHGTGAPEAPAPGTGAGQEPRPAASPGPGNADAEPDPDGPAAAPASPVRAVDAEGLELLAPRDYKRTPGALVPLLIVLGVVLAALIVVLIVFVL